MKNLKNFLKNVPRNTEYTTGTKPLFTFTNPIKSDGGLTLYYAFMRRMFYNHDVYSLKDLKKMGIFVTFQHLRMRNLISAFTKDGLTYLGLSEAGEKYVEIVESNLKNTNI